MKQHKDHDNECCHSHCDDHHEHHHEHHHESGCCCCGHDHEHEEMSVENKKIIILKYVFGAIAVIVGFLSFIPFYIPLIAAVAACVLFGIEVYADMLKGFAEKKIFTEFTLMCVATVGAFIIGEYADAAALMYLYALGESISSSAYSRSKKDISRMIKLSPEYATVIREGTCVTVSPQDVNVGDVIIVRVGERIPLDGTVMSGGGYADASSVTGESAPISLYEGIFCPSGAVLTEGTVNITVKNAYQDSVAVKMQMAVEEAAKRRSSAEKKIGRFAAVFTPIAFAVAAGVFILGSLFSGDVLEWARAAIIVLVVSCPCSMVLSVPLAYFAGIGNAATHGILLRGGEIMDRVAKLSGVVFDKTGTITRSHMSFSGIKLYSDMTEEEFLSLAKSVLIHSSHTVAASFCRECDVLPSKTVCDVINIAGKGMICKVENREVLFGNSKLMADHGIPTDESEGTCIYGAVEGVLQGRIDFSSHLKDNVRETVESLRAHRVDRLAVISGDVHQAVRSACEDAGIEEYYYSCTPDEKLDKLSRIMDEQKHIGGYTAFCGDGLNDSAAIAASDVGIAMGACGSALTVENADVVLMDDDPGKIITAIKISRRTEHIANMNIALALGIKIGVLLVGVVLAYFNIDIPMGFAIIADVGAAVITVFNSLRAGRKGNL